MEYMGKCKDILSSNETLKALVKRWAFKNKKLVEEYERIITLNVKLKS